MSVGLLLLAGWACGVASVIGWAVWEDRREQRRIDAVVRAYAKMTKTVRPQATEFERRRLLREFSRKHGNAEIVKLGKDGPTAA